jgi:hypothetical protein
MRRRAIALLGLLFLLSLVAGDARADAPFAQGWWWAPNDAALPATPPAVPTITIPLSPPDVPEGGLYVATNPTGMEAMAALLYVIPDGAKATALTLAVAGTPTGTPKIQLCPTTSAWAQAQAGAWGSRPQYACAPDAPVGTLAADGTSMTWPLTTLSAAQAFDVALVPVISTDPTASTSRITFAKPGPQSLSVTPAEVVEEPFSIGPIEPPAPPTSFDSLDVIAASGSAFIGGGLDYTPSVAAAPVVEGVAPRTNFENPAPRPGGLAANVVARPTARDNVQTIGMLGLIVLAAIYARFSGQTAREPRSLVQFAKHGGEGAERAPS